MKIFKSIMIVLLFLITAGAGVFVGNYFLEHEIIYNTALSIIESNKPYESESFKDNTEKRMFFEEKINKDIVCESDEVVRLVYETNELTLNIYYGADYYYETLRIETSEGESTTLCYYLNEKYLVFEFDKDTRKYVFKEEKELYEKTTYSKYSEAFEFLQTTYNTVGLKGMYTKYFDYTTVSNPKKDSYSFIGYLGYNEELNESTHCFDGTIDFSKRSFNVKVIEKQTEQRVGYLNMFVTKKDKVYLPKDINEYISSLDVNK